MARMRVVSPLLRAAEVKPLVDAGADEFYCGYLPTSWLDRYTGLVPLNRRDTSCSFTSADDLSAAIDAVHTCGKTVLLTLNGLYVADQYGLLDEIIDGRAGLADGIVVADLGLLMHLQERNFPGRIHVSTGGTCFNSGAISMYRRLGASRIVLPRELLLADLLSMCRQDPGLELEVFALGTACPNIDGFCTFYHGDPVRLDPKALLQAEHVVTSYDPLYTGPLCSVDYICSYLGETFPGTAPAQRPQRRVKTACAGCALFDLSRTFVQYLKIVGRGLPLEHKLTYVSYVREVAELADQEHDREAYQAKVKAVRTRLLGGGHECYYPDGRWDAAGCKAE